MHNHPDRDLIGYGPNPPDPQWPGEARIAVSFVLNYEEGGENTILNGDSASEVFLTETPGGTPIQGGRDLSTESMYEYGSRPGWGPPRSSSTPPPARRWPMRATRWRATAIAGSTTRTSRSTKSSTI